jgi:hypothetical protein
MSYAQPSHRFRLAAALGSGVLAATILAVIPPTAAQAATLPGTLAVTTPANGKLAADTAKQVVVLTVSGSGATLLTEDNVSGVQLGSDTDCDDLTNYVVTSPTTITVKTPTGGCAAAAGEEVAILFNSNADKISKAAALSFIAPPEIEAVGNKPVINDSSALLATANQQRRFSSAGGQLVRVKADPNFAFDPRTAAALAVSMGGKPGTELKVYATADGTVPLATSAAGSNGNSLTFKTAAGMTDNTVTLTQNGVSKSFANATHLATVSAVPTVTGLSVNAGRSEATGVSTVISGTNLPKVLADAQDPTKWTVEFCGVAASVTAVSTTGTSLTVTIPDIAGEATGLGASTYAGTCRVKVTDVVNSLASPISSGAAYTALNE